MSPIPSATGCHSAWLAIAVMLIASGCGEASDAPRCRDGFQGAADGHCYPPANPWPDPTLDDVLAALPPCESTDPDGAIDLAPGCADGACVGMTVDEMASVLGSEPSCQVASWSDQKQLCLWDMGIEGLFEDEDEDGQPDAESVTERIHLLPPYAGQTPQGSGVAVQVSCFIEDLGKPEYIEFEDEGGTLMLTDLIYTRYGLNAYDWGSDSTTDGADGRIDNLYLYGEP